jgi:hypothetical protein
MPFEPTAQDAAWIADLEACRLERFGHREHLRAGWIYLRHHGLTDGAHRFIATLQRYADHHGAPDLYHETVTWAFLLLLQDRLGRMIAEHTWDDFAVAHPDLLGDGKALLGRHWKPDTLGSELARRSFVFPDRLVQGAEVAR